MLPPQADAPDEDLVSLVYFYEADHDAVIESLKPPIGKRSDYQPVVSAEFLKKRLDAITIGYPRQARRDRAGFLARPAVPAVQQCRVDLEAFELVMLRRPEDATPYPDDELARIQREHLAYHDGLREAGQVVTNGPVIDGPDPSLRGLTFYRTGSLARARELAEGDPAVRAGRLTVEVMTWWCPAGTMSKPGQAVSPS